jgi:hypothetical protein
MTLEQLQNDLKAKGAPPAAGTFMILNSRLTCFWIDVWLGAFGCKEEPNGAFYVADFRNEPVVELEEAP